MPTLGTGNVLTFEAAGADARLTADTAFQARWLGVYLRLRDAGGEDLGSFRVLELDGSQALLEGAAAIGGAVSFEGVYRFDRSIF